MRSKINFIRKRSGWPFPPAPQQQSGSQTFIEYVRGVIKRKEKELADQAYDRAKQTINRNS